MESGSLRTVYPLYFTHTLHPELFLSTWLPENIFQTKACDFSELASLFQTCSEVLSVSSTLFPQVMYAICFREVRIQIDH